MERYSIWSPTEHTYYYYIKSFETPWEARAAAVQLLKDGDTTGKLQVLNNEDKVVYEVEG